MAITLDTALETIVTGRGVVDAAGTAEALPATTQPVKGIIIVPYAGNTGNIYVGGSDVTSAKGVIVASNEVFSHTPRVWFDPAQFYVDADTNGEGFSLVYMKQ